MAPTRSAQGVRRRLYAMGTVFNFDIRTPLPEELVDEAVERACEWLRWVDETFSTYKDASDVNRLERGELAVDHCSAELRSVVDLCYELNKVTGGYFDAWAAGRFDPSGVVKGWSMERASRTLSEHGLVDHCLEGGGDVRLAGSPLWGTGAPWRVAVRHPVRRDAFCALLDAGPGAVATSGTYERGLHVLNPFTGLPSSEILSVSVVGPDLTHADAYATAALAMGPDAPGWLSLLESEGYFSLVVGAAGRGWSSPGLKRLRAAPKS
ncbi:MAG TPA: FAD:protein FMN transferase [Acidimicrobiales bacterium]|nr:FAD:protein FMN transferase [Acidimicrobiales bacterium]